MKTYDLIVVGLGAHGSAILHRAAQEGLAVLGIDRFSPPHNRGSHHGDSRVTREAQFEGEHLVPIIRAGNQWRASFEDKAAPLFIKTGFLNISASRAKYYAATRAEAVAQKHGIRTERMSASEIARRFPCFRIPEGYEGIYEPDAGYLRPEACINFNLVLARTYGAEILLNTEVASIVKEKAVLKDGQIYHAKHIILAAGAYIGQLLPKKIGQHIKPIQAAVAWFKIRENYALHKLFAAPAFALELSEKKMFYGLPAIDGPEGGVKIGIISDLAKEARISPENHSPDIAAEEILGQYGDITEYLPYLLNECVRTSACMYSMTPDEDFVIEPCADMENVWVCSACSSHGFKLSHGIGIMMTDIVKSGRSDLYSDRFSSKRFETPNVTASPPAAAGH